MKELEENVDWVFLNDSNILIKSGRFENILYRYNKVKLYEKEIEGKKTGILDFDFTITSVNDEYSTNITEAFEKDSEFQTMAGDILCTLLQNDKIRIGEKDLNGEA